MMRPIKSFLVFFLLVLVQYCSKAQNHYVYTFAGTGNAAYSGDNGLAVNAELWSPRDVKFDRYGNMFIADNTNQAIRKINMKTNKIETILYNQIWTMGFSDLHFDTANTAFIICSSWFSLKRLPSNNNTMLNVAGSYPTLGCYGDGGVALAADLGSVWAVYVDTPGNKYVGGSCGIRKIDPQTNIITTITPTLYETVTDIIADKEGNLIFTMLDSPVVCKLDLATGNITNIAGTGNIGIAGDGGPALAAEFNAIMGICFDKKLNLFIAESERIRKIDAVTGIVSTYAGVIGGGSTSEGTLALNAKINPGHLTIDEYGNIYVTASYAVNEHKIMKITGNEPVVNMSNTTLTVQVYEECGAPQFIARTPTYNPNYTMQTYYGDGTSDVVTFASNGGAHVSFAHDYRMSGTYPVKHILYDGNTTIDSIIYLYNYHVCRSMNANFYYDTDINCLYNPLIDKDIAQPVTIRVDSNNVPVDTLSVTTGFAYNAFGDIGDVYSFNIIDVPEGLQYTCGPIVDTITSVIYHEAHSVGLQCILGTNVDLGVHANQQTIANRCNTNIVVHNSYCSPGSSDLTMTFSPKYTFSSAYPAPTSQNANVITWHMDNSSFDDNIKYLNVQLLPNGQILTPGDTVHTKFEIITANPDVNPSDNIIVRLDTVRGPFDPNAVYVSPESCVAPGTNLEYTVTFENMGNDTAYDIHVMDTLSAGFEMSTFKLLASSHPMNVTKLSNGGYNILKFEFPNINLPDSSNPARHGMVMYTIDMVDNFPINSAVTNKAGIYFDYMPAVLTNVASTTACWPASVNEATTSANNIHIYPNPATDELTIKTEQAYSLYTITNSIGQVMMSSDMNSKESKVNIKSLATGIYYLSLEGQGGTEVRKFVKL